MAVIDAALISFARNGYKKTSVSDIASAAGISKAMVFHYFGSKKDMYMYLVKFCGDTLVREMKERFDASVTDFFDRIAMASEIKISVLKKYPGLFAFTESMYYETDSAVEGDVKKSMSVDGETFNAWNFWDGVDYSRFREGVDPQLVLKILIYFTEGCLNEKPRGSEIDIEVIMKEFRACAALLKNNFYRESAL